MRGVLVLALLSVCVATAAVPPAAGPYLSPVGVVNAASLTPSRLPGGSIARGSEFQLSGVGIGPTITKSDSRFPLKQSLAGVTVTATAGANTYQAWPTYVSASTVRAVLPPELPAGPVTLRLAFGGRESNPVTVNVVEQSPGLFSVNGLGYGPGRIGHIDHIDDDEGDDEDAKARLKATEGQSKKAHGRGALAGLLATGLGIGTVGVDDAAAAEVVVGGVVAETFFVRKSRKRPGTDEVGFRVPADAPLGCYVPVQIVVGGVASNAVTMEIGNSKNDKCSDAFNPASQALREGGDVALALLSRVVFEQKDGSTVASDLAAAAGRTMKRDDSAFEPVISWPPPGSCTVYSGRRDMPLSLPGRSLYLGKLSVSNASQTARQIPFFPAGVYSATWGRNDPAAPMLVPPPPFLDPGVFKFAGAGGSHVGPFAVERTLEAPPRWINAANVRDVMRSEDLVVEWDGAGTRQVFVMGSASSHTANAAVSFQCLARPGASSMTIPAAVLGRMPSMSFSDDAAMEVGAFAAGTPATFDAHGLRAGVLFITSASAHAVRFK